MIKQKYKVIFIFGILLLSSFIAIRFAYKGWNKFEAIKKDSVVTSLNLERLGSGVPVIEKNWVVQRKDSFHIYWSDRNRMVRGSKPYHLYKDITLEKGLPRSEKDAFHYEMSDTLAFRLISIYNWSQKTFEYELVKYRSSDPDPVSAIPISKAAYDSILRRWEISIKIQGED